MSSLPPGQFLQPASVSTQSDARDPVLPEDNNALVTGPGTQGGPWTDYQVFNRYIDDPHVYMAAVTSPDGFQKDSCAFVQLAASTLILACDWTAARWGTPPIIPDPDLKNESWIFLGKSPETAAPPLNSDGESPLYRISGTYYYGNRKPNPKTFPEMNFPRLGWVSTAVDRSLPEDILTQGMITQGTQSNKNADLLTGFTGLRQ